MIVGYNEEHFLKQCFESISFCDEIIYTDLGSTDSSLEIAKKYADQIYHRPLVPSCEMIQTEVVNFTRNDWVLFIDPDEKIDVSLSEYIVANFDKIRIDDTIGGVIVPWQFYFGQKKLHGTFWGGMNRKYLFVNKHRFHFEPVVHYGRKIKDGYNNYFIKLNSSKTNVLHHYWMKDFRVFMKKHLRYLKNEGQDRYNLGLRTGWPKVMLAPGKEFYRSFYTLKGYKDGLLGFGLSLFWSWYESSAIFSLYSIQKKMKRSI
jgi:glycosyltransferase involved in cell wall biosynthesis